MFKVDREIGYGGGFIDTAPMIVEIRTFDPDPAESAKATLSEPDFVIDTDGRQTRNGVIVPKGARFFWARISDERPDLENEITDSETLRRFSDYIIAKCGWVDYNHYSRPAKFPKSLAEAGRSPEEYKIGLLTGIRVSPDGTSYAEGFLWPAGVNKHADTVWQWLVMAPNKVFVSVGGPTLSRDRERLADGRCVTRLKMLMNHLAICDQGIHLDTEMQTVPFGEFLKAVVDGVEDGCTEGGCFGCFVRGDEPAKGMVSAGGPGGTVAQGAVPEDLEGAAHARRFREVDETPHNCGHTHKGKLRLRSDAEALDHMTGCLGWSARSARDTLSEARKGREEKVAA